MNRKSLILILIVYFFTACTGIKPIVNSPTGDNSKFEHALSVLQNANQKQVLVAAHRGDWRNAPENSIQALRNSIRMGVDILELDLKMTKDSVLIIMHDNTIDRTTSGKGKPEDFTFEELMKLRLRNGLGRVSDHHTIPAFASFLKEAKGKIILDVDKGYDYFPWVIKMLREENMLQQAIINIPANTTLEEVEKVCGPIDEDITIMPVIEFMNVQKAQEVIESYFRHKRTIFQIVWKDDEAIKEVDFNALHKKGFPVWVNSLWASRSGGHNDDRAVEQNQPDETWGWLINKGATVIQTDRPRELLQYLRERIK